MAYQTGYTPAYQIVANGKDLAAALNTRLLSLVLNDEVGINSDTCEFTIDDRNGEIGIPSDGADLEVSIGYKETGLVNKGRYRVDEIECAGPERQMLIRARAADKNDPVGLPQIKGAQSFMWLNPPGGDDPPGEPMTLVKIATKISGRNGLGLKIDEEIGQQLPVTGQQTGESDLHYLRREAQNAGGVLKVANGMMLIFPQTRGFPSSASNGSSSSPALAMPTVSIAVEDALRWRYLRTRRNAHNQVRAAWVDENGIEQYQFGGDGEDEDSEFEIPEKFPADKGVAALAAAQAKAREFRVASDSVSLTLVGNPQIGSEVKLLLSGFKPGVDQLWVVARVIHRIDEQGYVTEVEAVPPA